jgi:hypothetical protein
MSGIPPQIVKAVAIDINTDTEFELKQIGQRNLGIDRFEGEFNGYEIRLRFDWGDIDVNGDPKLDCDFYAPGNSKPDKGMKKHPAHHTKKEFDPVSGLTIYEYKYSTLVFQLILQTTNIKTITATARIVKPM